MFFEQYNHEPNIAVARFWQMFGVDAVRRPSARPGSEAARRR